MVYIHVESRRMRIIFHEPKDNEYHAVYKYYSTYWMRQSTISSR